jgi:hypothetical protein
MTLKTLLPRQLRRTPHSDSGADHRILYTIKPLLSFVSCVAHRVVHGEGVHDLELGVGHPLLPRQLRRTPHLTNTQHTRR